VEDLGVAAVVAVAVGQHYLLRCQAKGQDTQPEGPTEIKDLLRVSKTSRTNTHCGIPGQASHMVFHDVKTHLFQDSSIRLDPLRVLGVPSAQFDEIQGFVPMELVYFSLNSLIIR
jgi:hypothetical protein